MTADEFKVVNPESMALWFKYRTVNAVRDWPMLFKDTSAKLYYEKKKRLYDNAYSCLVNEGIDAKEFINLYFNRPGFHSPEAFQNVVERRCTTFYKNIRKNFGKTVRNVCSAMEKRGVKSSRDVLKILADTGMLAPNFLAGRISVFWLAGVHDFSAITRISPQRRNVVLKGAVFNHRDDFDSTFNVFLEQKEVYYHQLCLAFGRPDTEMRGIDSIAVTDRQYAKQREARSDGLCPEQA